LNPLTNGVDHQKTPGSFGNRASSDRGGKNMQAVLTAYHFPGRRDFWRRMLVDEFL
jgi:hypothetical protein